MTQEPSGAGLFASIERVASTLLGIARTRFELASVEIEEQVEYLIGILLWSIGVFFLGVVTTLLGAVTVIVGCWETHRLLAALLVTLLFAVFSLGAYLRVRSLLVRRPRFFGGTLAELDDDIRTLREPRR